MAYRLIAASTASRSAGFSGWLRSRPEISATKSGVSGVTVMLMTVSCGYSVSTNPYSPRKRHAANPQTRPARRLPEGSPAYGRLGPPQETRRRDHGLSRAVLLGRGCCEKARTVRHAGLVARAHGL